MASMLRSAVSRAAPRSALTASLTFITAVGPRHKPSSFALDSLPSTPYRSIFSSRPLSATATATSLSDADHADTDADAKHSDDKHVKAQHAEREPSTLSGYIDRFGGWYPLLGLGAFVLVSKELLVLNEEMLMVSNFAAFVFISWLVAGDSVNEAVKAKADARAKLNDDLSDLYIEGLEQVIKAGESSLATIPLLKSLKEQYSSLGEQVIKSKEMKARAAARDAVIARLNAVYQKEQTEKARYLTDTLNAAMQQVRDRVRNLSQEDKNLILDDAIRQLGGQDTQSADPIARIYQDVLTQAMQQGGRQGQGAQAAQAQPGQPTQGKLQRA